jgi:hypothetical protein
MADAASRWSIAPSSSSRGAWDAYVWVDDADALHEELRSAGVTIEPEGGTSLPPHVGSAADQGSFGGA